MAWAAQQVRNEDNGASADPLPAWLIGAEAFDAREIRKRLSEALPSLTAGEREQAKEFHASLPRLVHALALEGALPIARFGIPTPSAVRRMLRSHAPHEPACQRRT